MKKYLSLMKLRVVELLLVTTVPALFLASNGVPDISITIWSLLGGTLAAGGANAFNMVIESKSDQLMKRTSNRPIATGEISKANGLVFATLVSILSLLIFYVFTSPLATALTAGAIIFYVLGYTLALKTRTSQNIVWGGIAGCMPALIGQAAVTNTLTLTSWLFFLLIFFWTPPFRRRHTYAALSCSHEICNQTDVVSLNTYGGYFNTSNYISQTFTLGVTCFTISNYRLENSIDKTY